jgi:hypothetical protein
VAERKVEVYFDPAPNAYKFRADYPAGENAPIVIDGVKVGEVTVDDLMQ